MWVNLPYIECLGFIIWSNFGTTYPSISTNLWFQHVGESSPQISRNSPPQAESEQKKVVDQVSETARVWGWGKKTSPNSSTLGTKWLEQCLLCLLCWFDFVLNKNMQAIKVAVVYFETCNYVLLVDLQLSVGGPNIWYYRNTGMSMVLSKGVITPI